MPSTIAPQKTDIIKVFSVSLIGKYQIEIPNNLGHPSQSIDFDQNAYFRTSKPEILSAIEAQAKSFKPFQNLLFYFINLFLTFKGS